MSRWSSGNWAIGAVVIENDGEIYPISDILERRGITVTGYYEEPYLFRSDYFEICDVVGEPDSRNEGFFTIKANLRLTDKFGNEKILFTEREGYTSCDEDCYMLLIITPDSDLSKTEIELQTVEFLEFKEAVGEKGVIAWQEGRCALKLLDDKPF